MDKFTLWMEEVDVEIEVLCSVVHQDLPDQPYREWFDDEMDPAEAARNAVDGA